MVQFFVFIIDSVLINLVFLLSFVLRYGWPLPENNFGPYRENFLFITFVYMLCFAFFRVFKDRYFCHWEILRRVLVAMGLGTLFGFMLVYLFRLRWAAFPSSVFAISFPVGCIVFFLVHKSIYTVSGRIKKKVVVIGHERGDDFLEDESRLIKYRIQDVTELLHYQDIDEVVICENIHEQSQLNLLLYLLQRSQISVFFSPTLYSHLLSENIIENGSIHYLATMIGKKSDGEEFAMRLLDVMVAVGILLVTLPLMLATSILIKITSRGGIFYIQERVGKDGQIFKLIKFRTMVADAEKASGPVLASQNDSRVTSIGKLLRQTRIDELPQVLNVLKGDMSMVGPRPERLYFTRRHHALRGIRVAIKPGLTGLAQIRGAYDLKPMHKIKYDYLYIQRRSVRLNLFLLWKTVPVLINRKGQ